MNNRQNNKILIYKIYKIKQYNLKTKLILKIKQYKLFNPRNKIWRTNKMKLVILKIKQLFQIEDKHEKIQEI